MDPNKIQDEEVLTDEQVVDELTNWFNENSDDEDPSASDDYEYDDDSSPSEDEDDSEPEDKDQDFDAEQASGEGTSTKSRAQDDPYAWVAELDPDLKHKVEALVHRDRSNTGRVAALTRRLDQIQAQQMAESPSRAAQQSASPTGKAIEDMTDDELREFEEEFPTVARNMKKIIEQRVAREREEILGQVRPFQQQIQAQQLMEQKEALRHNAEVIFNTEETGLGLDDVLSSPRWREWLASQPKGYQQFALAANTVEDASKVLEDFAAYADREVMARYGSQIQEESKPSSSKADQTAARRKSALRGSTPKSRSAELADRGNNSAYEDYFNEAVEGS